MSQDVPVRRVVHVALGPRSYDIVITTGELADLARLAEEWLRQRFGGLAGRKALLVTDEHLRNSHARTVGDGLRGAGWSCGVAVVPPGESSKSLPAAAQLYDRLVDLEADRHTLVVAVGGGVVGDLAGYVAATYARGLPFAQVPTTLLAHVDSSVGGKVGVNHPRGKNLIGAFHQPIGVLIDTVTLETLPDRDYRSGLAEVIKYGVILDAAFFEYLEMHVAELNSRQPDVLADVISRCCRLKADVVEQDEFEVTGLRSVLNYGHTFAHAFEALAGYGELRHGEAVAIGMVHAARLAERRGLVDRAFVERLGRLLSACGLPIALPAGTSISADEAIGRMKLDKKTVAGNLRFVLPTRLGHVDVFTDVPLEDVRAVF